MDGTTTYCYYVGEKYSQEHPRESDVLVAATGAACPVTIRVDIADVLARNEIVPIRYTATLRTDGKDANFEFPDPIQAAAVPEYLSGANNSVESSGSSSSGGEFDVPVANVVICDWRTCDIFTSAADSSNYYASSNNPNDFDSAVAVFGSQELILPKEGKYTGYVHLVVNIAGNSRADFVTFFPVQIGDVAGTAPSSIVADGTTTYCWTAKDVSVFDPSVSGALTVRSGANCPGSMSMGLSATSLEVLDMVNIAWKLDMSGVTTDDSTLIGEVSTTDAIANPRTGVYSVVPVAVFSGCQKNAVGANCSTYSGDDSTTFDIAEFDDSNLTSNAVTYSTNYTFTDAGQYTMIGRVAMVTVDGMRVDMAVYSTVTVSVPSGSSTSSVFLYVGIGIGCAILLLGLLFCFLRKRRNKVNTKNIPFREPTAVLAAGREGRASQYTVASSNFLTHKTPTQARGTTQLSNGAGYANSDPNSIVLSDYSVSGQPHNYYAQPQQYGQHSDEYHGHDQHYQHQQPQYHQQPRGDESLSLDPYDRPSFADLASESDAESVARPSDMAKFSFQSGFDDETEWEYDMRPTHEILGSLTGTSHDSSSSQLSELSTEPDLHRGTFDLARGMPILEEDVDDAPPRERGVSGGSNDPRSTTSSRWTINTH